MFMNSPEVNKTYITTYTADFEKSEFPPKVTFFIMLILSNLTQPTNYFKCQSNFSVGD